MNDVIRKKGGRPKKPVCRDQQLAVMCTSYEREIIEDKAKKCRMSNSEFLRTLGLKGQVVIQIKTLPKEILLFTATLNHLAANMNQVAKKRNKNDELNAIERAELTILSSHIKRLSEDIKKYLL